MTHLLHVAASPSAGSRTRTVADALIGAWRGKHPEGTFDEIDVWQIELPEFDADMIAAKFAVLRSQQASKSQQALWERAVACSL